MKQKDKLIYEAIENNIKSKNGELTKSELYGKVREITNNRNDIYLKVDALVKTNKVIIKNNKLIWIDFPEIYKKLDKNKTFKEIERRVNETKRF